MLTAAFNFSFHSPSVTLPVPFFSWLPPQVCFIYFSIWPNMQNSFIRMRMIWTWTHVVVFVVAQAYNKIGRTAIIKFYHLLWFPLLIECAQAHCTSFMAMLTKCDRSQCFEVNSKREKAKEFLPVYQQYKIMIKFQDNVKCVTKTSESKVHKRKVETFPIAIKIFQFSKFFSNVKWEEKLIRFA